MNSDIDLMWAYLEKNPLDDTAKRGLADKCQEEGDEEMAYTLRWLVKHRRWPTHNKDFWQLYRNGWGFAASRRKEWKTQTYYIQTPICRYAENMGVYLTGRSKSLKEHIGKLAAVLSSLRSVLEA